MTFEHRVNPTMKEGRYYGLTTLMNSTAYEIAFATYRQTGQSATLMAMSEAQGLGVNSAVMNAYGWPAPKSVAQDVWALIESNSELGMVASPVPSNWVYGLASTVEWAGGSLDPTNRVVRLNSLPWGHAQNSPVPVDALAQAYVAMVKNSILISGYSLATLTVYPSRPSFAVSVYDSDFMKEALLRVLSAAAKANIKSKVLLIDPDVKDLIHYSNGGYDRLFEFRADGMMFAGFPVVCHDNMRGALVPSTLPKAVAVFGDLARRTFYNPKPWPFVLARDDGKGATVEQFSLLGVSSCHLSRGDSVSVKLYSANGSEHVNDGS
jgi:hypothetical protein